ncbi:MAG TPA: peptidylprolyl isomerase [Thermodesulfovibrionales bacterium]|nr:peptidylprolyl isomerase [Thermodesulfovibrionales bacterium]
MKRTLHIHRRELFAYCAFPLLSLAFFASPLHAARKPLVRIIVVSERADAEKLLSEIHGGKSFASLAKESSLDKGSRERYGEIEETAFESLDKPLKEAAFRMGEGEVSEVIPLGDNRHALLLVVDLAYYRKGAKAFRSGDVKTAEMNLLKHVELNPDAVKARVILGQIYEAGNEAKRAEEYYKDALRFDPVSEEAYERLAALYLRTGQLEQARDLYDEGLRHVPDSKTLKRGMEKTKTRLSPVASVPSTKETIKSRPSENTGLESGVIKSEPLKAEVPKEETRKGEVPISVKSKTETAKSTEDKRMHLRIILTGRESDAQDILSQIRNGASFALLAKERSVDDTTRATYGYLGEVALNSVHASIQEALSNLREGETSGVITMEPNRYAIVQVIPMSLYTEGEKAFIAGDFATAEERLLKYVEMNPDAVKASTMLGKIYEDKKELSKAIELYEKAILFGPQTVLAYERLARVYLFLGMFQKAREVYVEGLKKTPSSVALQEGVEMADLLLIGRGERMP